MDELKTLAVYSPRCPYPGHALGYTGALLIQESMPRTHLDKILSCSLHVPALISIFRCPEIPFIGHTLDTIQPLAFVVAH